ncbi:MAG TPA: cytochrome C oxidase subunit IV family protein [Fimbriimonadaceae bacterium]|jgi:caa(3)-type oxidase subunit IV
MSTAKHSNHAHHITPLSTLFGTFCILVFLMTATVVSSYIQITPLVNNAINLGIAVAKASFVVRIFMGYKYTSSLAKLFALAGFVWLMLMTITFGDYFTRKWEYTPGWYKTDTNGAPMESEVSQSPLSKAVSVPDYNKNELEH